MKILLVEDDEVAMFILVRMIKKLGHSTICCSDGERAFDAFDDTIDLVITDLMLPNISGIELIEKINNRYGKNTPVLLMSGMPDEILLDKAGNSGARGLLSKPYTLTSLGDKINELFLVRQ